MGMAACVPFESIVSESRKPVDDLEVLKNSEFDCERFVGLARQLEFVMDMCFKVATRAALSSSEEAVEIWKNMIQLCNVALGTLVSLKERYPDCGGPELYDRTLEMREICLERQEEAQSEVECLNHPQVINFFQKAS